MASIYVLRSLKDNKLYIGSTRWQVDERVSRHNNGQVVSTKNRRPFICLYSEDFKDYSIARKREIYLKTGSGREHLERILSKWVGGGVANRTRL